MFSYLPFLFFAFIRTFLAQEIGIPQNSSAQQVPLLYTMLQMLQSENNQYDQQ